MYVSVRASEEGSDPVRVRPSVGEWKESERGREGAAPPAGNHFVNPCQGSGQTHTRAGNQIGKLPVVTSIPNAETCYF